ncbi:MAG TPA: RNA-binding cell elongation regulator Jag/EloR [Thermoleophilia bacterium]|nr:RNA-binding cell elongation regulator Jag/EloR [Thermoleophilia bacterium]
MDDLNGTSPDQTTDDSAEGIAEDTHVEEPDVEETEFATVASAPTVEAAKVKALDQLRKVVPYVGEVDVEFVVLDEGGQGGFLGMGKSHPRVEARLRPTEDRVDEGLPAAREQLREFVERVTDAMGLDVHIDISETPEAIVADVAGDDMGIFIGRHGQTIDALQYLAAIVVNHHRQSRRQIVIDAEGYRERRESSLQALADRTAQKVTRNGTPMELKPMTAAERKIIHLHLKDHPRVQTVSDGVEPYRKIIVSIRRRDQ